MAVAQPKAADFQVSLATSVEPCLGDIMKSRLVVSAILSGALLGPAMAADLAPLYKAPPVPVCFWCGWYAGVNVGAAWAQDPAVQTAGGPAVRLATFEPEAAVAGNLATSNVSSKQSGFIGGGQVGYNWQASTWVYGAEADIQFLTKDVRAAPSPPLQACREYRARPSRRPRRFPRASTISGPCGLASVIWSPPGSSSTAPAVSHMAAFTPARRFPRQIPELWGLAANYGSAASISQTRAGWTAGAGVEMQLGPRWTAKVEYLYYDLGSVSYALPGLVANVPTFPSPTWTATAQSTAKFNGDIVRLGLNYKL